MLRIVHSFWTYPMISTIRWNESQQLQNNLWILALSVIYAKKHNNVQLILYTDDIGYNLLKDMPYDEIYTTLNDIKTGPYSEVFWAQGKFYAMQNEPLCSIHTDFDVFLKSDKCIDTLLEINNYDLIVQDTEFANGPEYNNQKQTLLSKCGINTISDYAYNCGVIGFNNKELKEKYFNNYFCNKEKIRQALVDKKISPACYDLNIEQEYLYKISKNYNTKTLLGIKNWNKYNEYNQKAIDLGYQHLIGQSKYIYIDKVKKLVKYYNQDIFNIINNLFK